MDRGRPQMIFVQPNPQDAVFPSLVIVRNPIGAFFALIRHLSPKDEDKVSPLLKPCSGCLENEAETRTELIGERLGAEGYNVRCNTTTGSTTTELLFQNYSKLWV